MHGVGLLSGNSSKHSFASHELKLSILELQLQPGLSLEGFHCVLRKELMYVAIILFDAWL